MSGGRYIPGARLGPPMVGLMGSLVGGIVLVALVLIGVWLTWISLRSEQHSPTAAGAPATPDDAE